jgi:hypothetical protein
MILTVRTDTSDNFHLDVSLPLRHLTTLTGGSRHVIKATYLYASSNPTVFGVLPPLEEGHGKYSPPILALRTSRPEG